METLFQLGKEVSELRARVEELAREAWDCRKAKSSSAPGQGAPVPAPARGLVPPAPLVHRVPRVPVFVDGVLLKGPHEITRYNGSPLYYTPLRTPSSLALAAFTKWERMLAEAPMLTRGLVLGETVIPAESHCAEPPDSLPEQVFFYEDADESGDSLSLQPNFYYPDLSDVRHGFLGLGNWDHIISSLSWCRWDVFMWDGPNGTGSAIWLPAGCNTPNLDVFGWNDRARTIFNGGGRLPA
jgi:hypothetical protein